MWALCNCLSEMVLMAAVPRGLLATVASGSRACKADGRSKRAKRAYVKIWWQHVVLGGALS